MVFDESEGFMTVRYQIGMKYGSSCHIQAASFQLRAICLLSEVEVTPPGCCHVPTTSVGSEKLLFARHAACMMHLHK
jgi:hypothetical protein